MPDKNLKNTSIIDLLYEELKKPLPGIEAQMKMIPASRRNQPLQSPHHAKKGAVLILLYSKNNQLNTCFIKRANDGGVHSGQISFPGGKREESDKDSIFTALRETEEEIGINMRNIKVIGKLTTLYIPVSNYLVLPVVANIDKIPEFTVNRSEVEEIIEVPLAFLFNPNIRKEGIIEVRGSEIVVPLFDLGKHKIWGATAMILCELHEIISKSGVKLD